MSEVNEETVDQIWEEITSEETKTKEASVEVDEVDDLIENLEKTASQLEKTAEEDDVDINEEELDEEEERDAEGLVKQMLEQKRKEKEDEDEKEKEANKKDVEVFDEKGKDVEVFDEKGVGGALMLRSDNPAKQRLKEIVFKGLKEGKESEKYNKLRQALADQDLPEEGSNIDEESTEKISSADEELIEELSDEVVEKILN